MNVVVGAGLAAVRAIESMRASGYVGPITLVGEEPHLPYERPPLSKEALAGSLGGSDLSILPRTFFDDHHVELRLGVRAVRLDAGRRSVVLASGERVAYERLLIATGSSPVPLRVDGADPSNVLSLRGMDDAVALRARLLASETVLVVGAGLVGLEVAAVARGMGKRVVVIERAPLPLDRLLGSHPIAESIRALHAQHGVELRTSTTVDAIEGDDRSQRAWLSDGTAVDADVIVAAIGVRPRTDWLVGSGIALDDGVVVDVFGETNLDRVFAAGDVARLPGPDGALVRLESYGHAHEQGAAVGRTMAGVPSPYLPFAAASSEQHGARIQVLGRITRELPFVVRGDFEARAFAALFFDGHRVVGALAMNRPRDIPLARRLIVSRSAVEPRELALA